MRADRLVATLLLLQARGRLTARTLADELEVSVRTARRDLEALGVAGVPVYAQPGRGGGWSLLGDARTDLSGLTAAEARALFLVAGPSSGGAHHARAALRKLVAALPETFRADAAAAASAVVVDPAGWGGAAAPVPSHLDVLQRGVIEARQVHLAYADRRGLASERTVHPLGLVHKAASWYLVADSDRGLRTFHVSRIRSVDLLDAPATRPPGFDLEKAWSSVVETVEQRRRIVRALVRIAVDDLWALRAQLGADLTVRELDAPGLAVVEVAGSAAAVIAQHLAGWGSRVEVVAPDAVRRELARIGSELASLYEGPTVGSIPPAGDDTQRPGRPRA